MEVQRYKKFSHVLEKNKIKKLSFVAFANFLGINTPTIADFILTEYC